MLRQLKTVLVVGLLMAGIQLAQAFSLIGPIIGGDEWQVPELGYDPLPTDGAERGPKNLGEEYRRNVPILHYAFDANFLDYFGSNGVFAVEQAFAILNSLTNFSSYSEQLTEIPLSAQRENYLAAALGLTDLKSMTLWTMLEQLGLADPERFVWTLRARDPEDCPTIVAYLVTQRNFDPVTFEPSSYVNGVLYSYFIYEDCGDGDPPDAEAMAFPVDPLAEAFTSIAGREDRSFLSRDFFVFGNGKFFTYLTRDDVGGLRYLYRSNNINWESAGPATETFITNAVSPEPLITLDLNELLTAARVNDADALAALFPGLISTSTLTGFGLVTNFVVTDVIVSAPPWAPAGTLILAQVTNATVEIAPIYSHNFANVITNVIANRSLVAIDTLYLTNLPFAPVGSLPVLVTNRTVYATNTTVGSFFIIPEDLCGVTVLSNILTSVVPTTTSVVTSNVLGEAVSIQNTTTFFTNQALAYLPISCETNTVTLRQGIENISFRRANFDSLVGRFFEPITNVYQMTIVTNGMARTQTIRRVITEPDFLFSAQDMIGDDLSVNFMSRTIDDSFDVANIGAGLAGPGTIVSPGSIIFNKVGPIFFSGTPNSFFLNLAEASQFPWWIWGHFDGTTNAPIVYPDGTSIKNLENQILIWPTPAPPALPSGTVGVLYSVALTAQGGQPPYTWSLPGAGLPTGLMLAPGGVIAGTPVQSGVYDLVIRLTDSSNRVVDWNYSITINP